MGPEISVIVPLRDESANVLPLTQQILASFGDRSAQIELLLVDDGSIDDTWERIQEVCRSHPHVRGLRHARNAGQSAALWTGFKASHGAIIATLDGDLQNDPADFPRMLQLLADCDMVCGVRTKRADSWVRLVSSRVARVARKWILGVDFADSGCNLRVFKRTVLETLPAFDGLHRFMPILAHNAGFKVKQVPVAHHPRAAGRSKYGVWNRLGRGLRDLLMVRLFLKRQIGQVPIQTLMLAVLLAAAPFSAQGISAENGLFFPGLQKLKDGFYEQAERDFGQFLQQFPESARLSEAVLYQAQARFKLNNYAGAIELLSARQNQAGKLADEFLFWIAESYSHKGEHLKAADTFGRLVKEFPASSRLLEASVKQAAARSKLEKPEWPRVIELLQPTNGIFQAAARTNSAIEWIVRGHLLLSEAYLAQTNYHAAEAVLLPLGSRLIKDPAIMWQWQYLICRAQLGDGRAEAALLSTSNLVAQARSAEQPRLLAQSFAFKGGVLERLGRLDQAIEAYTNNLVAAFPAEYQQQALLKMTELALAQNRIPEATQTLEKFLAQYPQAASADLAWLTLGELRLRQLAATLGTNYNASTVGSGPTNLLQKPREAFETLIKQFPQSPRFGMGQLDLGWCLFLEGRLPESQKAFQSAVERLPLSPDLARAHFKLADAQFRQKDFVGAITNYNAIIQKFGAFPEVETNLFEPALYQAVQASLAAGDLLAATNAMQKLLTWYPNGFHTDRAVLLTGQEIGRAGNPTGARQLFTEYSSKATNTASLPEVKLAIARTWEQENNWTNAIQQYQTWLTTFTNHPARPRAEYSRALAYFHAQDQTNALICFTNFLAQFPTNEFAPSAQWWVADYYYGMRDFIGAERDFQLLFSKWPASELACSAVMMAGHAAVARQRWEDAKDYFRKLYDQTNCPIEVRLQALFAYGDYWMSRDSTNRPADYLEAIRIFSKIYQEHPGHQVGLNALGRKGDALLQSGQLEEAFKAYQQLTTAPGADVATRSKAMIGLAVVIEKQAEQKNGAERVQLLKLALDRCLDVLYPEKILREGETADPSCTKKAGENAIHLAEMMEDWPHVISACKALCRLMPVLCPSLEKKTLKAQESLRAKK